MDNTTTQFNKIKNVFIIAEAGVNHNGNMELAFQLIEAAQEAGANAVKFQTFKAENLVTKFAKKAKYQFLTTKGSEDQYSMIKKLELDYKQHKSLIEKCKERQIDFISSPFDLDSVDMLNKLGLEIIKIPSGEITNLPYLKKVGSLRKKVILSTGMSTLGEIEYALKILIENGTDKEDIVVLHCNTEYPTPYEDVNLNAMLTIKDAFKVNVGYSDHTLGIVITIAAVALGAKVIEKHFTLDKTFLGPDHKASLNTDEFRRMVEGIRIIEKSLGDGIKCPSHSEMANIDIVRKYIVAKRLIKEKDVLTYDNITVKRATKGISPIRWDEIIGRRAIRNFQEDEVIEI